MGRFFVFVVFRHLFFWVYRCLLQPAPTAPAALRTFWASIVNDWWFGIMWLVSNSKMSLKEEGCRIRNRGNILGHLFNTTNSFTTQPQVTTQHLGNDNGIMMKKGMVGMYILGFRFVCYFWLNLDFKRRITFPIAVWSQAAICKLVTLFNKNSIDCNITYSDRDLIFGQAALLLDDILAAILQRVMQFFQKCRVVVESSDRPVKSPHPNIPRLEIGPHTFEGPVFEFFPAVFDSVGN